MIRSVQQRLLHDGIVVPVTNSFCTMKTIACATSSGVPALGITLPAVMFL